MTTAFAHPIEAELAKLFDEHGLVWRYEPHTFVLERHSDGTVIEAFTPDFFLPELGIYVECTVMKQALTRRKRGKARRAAERTGAEVQILFRRDFERIARRWNLPALSRAAEAVSSDVYPSLPAGMSNSHMGEGPGTPRADRLFDLDVERNANGSAVVRVEGDLDLHSAPRLRDSLAQLVEDRVERVVIDLEDTTFLDSMALGVLLGAKRDLHENGGTLELVVTRDEIRRIFEITMLERVFVMHDARPDETSGGEGR